MTILESRVESEKKVSKNFTTVTKVVTRRETEIVWKGIVLPHDFEALIWDLMHADGLFDRIVINNRKLADALDENGYVHRNSRGSYGGYEKKLKKLYDEYCKIAYK